MAVRNVFAKRAWSWETLPPRGTCVGKTPEENPGMLEVPKEAWKADDGWMRGVSWDHIPAGNDIRHGHE